MKLLTKLALTTMIAAGMTAAAHAQSTIEAWDFTGESSQATSAPDFASTDLDISSVLSRGTTATPSSGGDSFRTQGFKNDGIAVTNTDYFEFSISASAGNTFSLTSIDIRTNGTAAFAADPGVSQQFAYSFDGTNFTLIGTPVIVIGTGKTSTFDLSIVPGLQNIPDTTTVTFRYYASGQTTSGGWGFYSNAPGDFGISVDGMGLAAIPEPSVYMLLGVGLLICGQRFLRRRRTS